MSPTKPLPPKASEALLIDRPPHARGEQALVISPGRAQLARHLCRLGQFKRVVAWYCDLHDAAQATQPDDPAEMQIDCAADLPSGPFDWIGLPVTKGTEAEWTRDLLQQAHQRLTPGGTLATSVDNPKDSWLHEQLRILLEKVSCERTPKGCVYWGRKHGEVRRVRDFSGEYAFRDEQGRLLTVVTRPGVFSHRRLDSGARQLMLAADVGEDDQVLDMGCGAGAVALAMAVQTRGQVYAVDGNARAIECVTRNARANDLENIVPIWNADGQITLPRPADLALANPPYFGGEDIGRHFVDTCVRLLRPGGALLVVTKKPSWYEHYFEPRLNDTAVFAMSRYHVVCGRRPD